LHAKYVGIPQQPIELPSGAQLQTFAAVMGTNLHQRPGLAVVSGLHGNECNGVAICHQMIRLLSDMPPHAFEGRVIIVPAANPLSLGLGQRLWPVGGLNVDFNRIFPGDKAGDAVERLASELLDLLLGLSMCVDIHSGCTELDLLPHCRTYPWRIPQGERRQMADAIAGKADLLNLPVLEWRDRRMDASSRATLAEVLLERGTPAVVIEGGTTFTLDDEFCRQCVSGLLSLMIGEGILDADIAQDRMPVTGGYTPLSVLSSEIRPVLAPHGGLFRRRSEERANELTLGMWVDEGMELGTLSWPIDAQQKVEDKIAVTSAGHLLALRRMPIVAADDVLALVCTEGDWRRRITVLE